MIQYKITTDLYILPTKSVAEKVLYAPCLGVVFQANATTLQLLSNIDELERDKLSREEKATLDYLLKKEIVNGANTFSVNDKKTVAAKLTLFPTNKCNLSCRYCYAGKYQSSAKSMEFNTAVNAIHHHGKILKENSLTNYTLELHGGGEPFVEFFLVKKIVEYVERYCQKENFDLEIAASTNGVFSSEKREWIKNHISTLLVSYEGLAEIQNCHRPFPDGSPTFSIIHNSLKYFDLHNYEYSIRTTVSNKNVNQLKETINFISNNYKTKLVILEPVNDCGNCSFIHNLNCDLKEFSKNYLIAERYARAKGIRTIYSGANIERISSNFCYVGTNQFAITPDGYLTNCWEVTSNNHPQANTFIVGKIKEDGHVEMYKEKLGYLKTLSVDQLPYCEDCFAKWHCSGDCAMRLGHNEYNGARGNRCETTRNLMAKKLIASLK